MNAAESPASNPPVTRREIFAWTLYDWANSAYSTILITIIVSYITFVLLPGGAGPIAYAWTIGISTLAAAILSPIIGAIADAHASKRRWLAFTALGGAACAIALALIPSEYPWAAIGAFFFASLGFELSLGFYNGFLPEITTEKTIDRISAYGFALGYIGGAIPLILAMLVTTLDDQLSPWVPDRIRSDYNETDDGRFGVELPSGRYNAAITAGDSIRARDEMEFQIAETSVLRMSTAAGEFATEHVDLDHDGGEIVVAVKRSGGASGRAAINAIEFRALGGGTSNVLFDFGTGSSAVRAAYIGVAPDDDFQLRSLEDKGFDAESRGEHGLPESLRYGWKSGDVTAHDDGLGARLRVGILMMGLWWGGFTIPSILMLRDRGQPAAVKRSVVETASMAVRRVGGTIRNVRVYRTLSLFLVGFLIYNDGVQTVISQASVFGIEVLSMSATELGGVILMIQFLAVPGAMLIALLSRKLGQRAALMICLAVWIAILCGAYFITARWQFWVMGVAVAMVMGGTQSVSRAIMGYMTPKAHTAEFFGFYNLSGKATSFLGPIFFSAVLVQTGAPHLAILSLLIFFLLGGGLVSRLDFHRGRREAGAIDGHPDHNAAARLAGDSEE